MGMPTTSGSLGVIVDEHLVRADLWDPFGKYSLKCSVILWRLNTPVVDLARVLWPLAAEPCFLGNFIFRHIIDAVSVSTAVAAHKRDNSPDSTTKGT